MVEAVIWPADSFSLSYVTHCRSGEPRVGGTSGRANVCAQSVLFVPGSTEQVVQFVDIPSILEIESKSSTFLTAHLRPAVSIIKASLVSDIRKLLSKWE